jgi:hypothetical protein
MTHAAEHSDGTPDAEQNQSARAGATAAGGIEPRPGDPDSPAAAAARAEETARAMREGGFGDHKGASID